MVRNELFFRGVNERLQRLERSFEKHETAFVCECGNRRCTRLVPLSLDEYRHVRANSQHFAILPGHEDVTVESVVQRGARFLVVAKTGAAAVAAEADNLRLSPH